MRKFSYQLYSSRNFPPLAKTLEMVAGFGYHQVEGYSGLFGSGVDIDALKDGLAANGLAMPTAHFGFEMVRDAPDRVIRIALALEIEAIFVPAVGTRQRDAAGWATFGRDLAEAGKPIRDAGLSFGWHNHDYEFADLGGADKPLDLILAGSDDLCLEIDVAWVQIGGEDPIEWIGKYADRIISVHVKDIAPPGAGAHEDGWADVGHGVMDWPGIMNTLAATKARYFIMEHDNPADDRRFAERSIASARKF
ncbi:MAG: sugar phosphate isomerase/epimerase [Pseudomonadota bacterium]